MFVLLLFIILFLLLIFYLHKRLKKTVQQRSDSTTQCSVLKSNPAHSLLLEILPSDSPKWDTLFENCAEPVREELRLEGERIGSDCGEKKKKNKRTKKKGSEEGSGGVEKKQEAFVSLCPFTTSSSATQRKIKQLYDQLLRSHESDGLTLAQIEQFVNCLIEARNEVEHRFDVIRRKFTITKALLFKADMSSFDRLHQQIYKLELERKRLKEDTFVYNWLRKQLKLSPAYKKMLEIGACMELQAKSCEQTESADSEVADISFEELLAQEKKDSFCTIAKKQGHLIIRISPFPPNPTNKRMLHRPCLHCHLIILSPSPSYLNDEMRIHARKKNGPHP